LRYRAAYRQLWLDELGGFAPAVERATTKLVVLDQELPGLDDVRSCAAEGVSLMDTLSTLVRDERAPASSLKSINTEISELDRRIEDLGFNNSPLGALTRMFVFSKENIQGTDALDLASQMRSIYQDLERRCQKFASYYQGA
jgi:hypothetical protein